MTNGNAIRGLCLALGCSLILACQDTGPTDPDLASGLLEPQGEKKLDPALCSPDDADFSDPLVSTNPYFPMDVGFQWVLEGEEDGEPIEVLITILGDTEVVDGVTTRVVEEREWEDGELVEVSRNFIANADDGTVCYFGEDVDDYEDGVIVGHEGAWRADDAGNFAGILMPADPVPGTKFPMEGAPGTAEDMGKIVAIGPVTVPAGPFTETIRVEESNPLEGEKGFKVYAAGVGILIDETLELVCYGFAC